LLDPPAGEEPWLPLETLIVRTPLQITSESPRIHVDASPWGGGGILYIAGAAREFWHTAWDQQTAEHLETVVGCPSGQTTWEYLGLFLSLVLWASRYRDVGVCVLGDNLASLNGILSLRGRKALTKITREVSWRKVRHRWRYVAGHLPTEHNTSADALSRLSAPNAAEAKEFPAELLSAAAVQCPEIKSLWSM